MHLKVNARVDLMSINPVVVGHSHILLNFFFVIVIIVFKYLGK